MAQVILKNLTKIYDDAEGTERAVDDFSMTVDDGEFVVIVGPSGCGKSTTLRMLAGLETVTEGVIDIQDREVQHLAPNERPIAMVFQNFALYRKMTTRGNMEYGLKHRTELRSPERRQVVQEMAEMLGIEQFLDQTPDELSGGQKQRVALGRALVRQPDVFLLDEPLANLDAKLRGQMRTELQRIHDEFGVTTIYVTHDQKEAMTMADRIAIMNDGVLQQVDEPEMAYHHPDNEFVATFLGSPAMNIFDVELRNHGRKWSLAYNGTEMISLPESSFTVSPEQLDDIVRLGIRPEHISLTRTGKGRFDANVTVSEYQGDDNFIHLEFEEEGLTARVPSSTYPRPGSSVGVSIAPEDVYVFDGNSGETAKTRGIQPLTT